jgi:hypothetical protein
MNVTYDPVCSSLYASVQDAFEAGIPKDETELSEMHDLSIFNQLVQEKSLPAILMEWS